MNHLSWEISAQSFENWTSDGNLSDFRTYCYTPKTFTNLTEYFECYRLVASEKVAISILELLVAFGAAFINGFVVFCLFVSSSKKTCFDQILVGYCLVNGITGLIDIPFFHVSDIFGYWPFGEASALIWSIYDNNINYNTAAHMFYASYARLRSLQNPRGYSRELLLKKPFIVMGVIWIASLAIWSIILGIKGNRPYTVIVDFNPFYLTTVLNIPWLFFVVGVFIIAVVITVFLFQKSAKDKQKRSKLVNNQSSIMTQSTIVTHQSTMSQNASKMKKLNKNHRFRIPAEKKFLIIMGSYLLQWTPPCIMVMISPFVYIDPGIYSGIYWLTYTVCLTDALNILILNPNIKIPTSKEIKKFFRIR